MTEQKFKSTSKNNICEKCGNSMLPRMLAVKKSKTFNFIKILQCSVCRHYVELKKTQQT